MSVILSYNNDLTPGMHEFIPSDFNPHCTSEESTGTQSIRNEKKNGMKLWGKSGAFHKNNFFPELFPLIITNINLLNYIDVI